MQSAAWICCPAGFCANPIEVEHTRGTSTRHVLLRCHPIQRLVRLGDDGAASCDLTRLYRHLMNWVTKTSPLVSGTQVKQTGVLMTVILKLISGGEPDIDLRYSVY